jgi:cytochrome c oxidase assembly protein subunit 15
MLWVALGLLSPYPRAGVPAGLRGHGIGVTSLVVVTILAGGFVAGTRAGFTFNDWPLMHGRFVPEGLYTMTPLWADWFENVATVQFHHRLLAYLLCLAIPAWWWMSRRDALDPATRAWFRALLAALAIQVLLGVTTLLYRVPLPLAAAHQAGALLLFTVALVLNHRVRRAGTR